MQSDKSDDTPTPDTLALVAQSLAAVLGFSAGAPPAVPAQPAARLQNLATDTVGDAAQGPGNSPLRELVALLAQNTNETRDAAGTDATPADSGSQSTPDSTATGDAPGASTLAQLGLGNHFAVQHARQDTNTGELRSPLGTAAWADELGAQITWMRQQGVESGSLRVSPEHLGPVEVHIAVQNGAASVWFGANHADTRAALEQALPRLREMFASQGLTLTDSGVSREPPRNQSRSPAPALARIDSISPVALPDSPAARLSLGLLDTYA